jgi:DNA-binding response OmpR family regulator
VAGQMVPLTSTEFKLLVELTRVPGLPVSREHLSNAVQAGRYRPQDRTVDVQVGRLRRRLAGLPGGLDWIETVRGEGYAFVPRGAAAAGGAEVAGQ